MTGNGSGDVPVRRRLSDAAWMRMRAILIVGTIALLGGCRERQNLSSTTNANGDDQRRAVSKIHTYSTTFPEAENPISEGGKWMGGSLAGRDPGKANSSTGGRLWGDVQTEPGMSFGVDEPTDFGDPTAILTGTWGPAQSASAKVKIVKTPIGNCCHEVELRLRTTISGRVITGYEAYCSVMPNNSYCHITRWNGPNGSYWNFEKNSIAMYLVDGDVIKATVTGINPVIITLYRNNVPIEQAFDTGAAGGGFGAYGPWTSGNPGIGFFNNHEINWKDFGLSSFSVTDDESATAPPAGGR